MNLDELEAKLTERQRGMIYIATTASWGILNSDMFDEAKFKPLLSLRIFRYLGIARDGEWFQPYTEWIFVTFRTFKEYQLTDLGYRLYRRAMERAALEALTASGKVTTIQRERIPIERSEDATTSY